MIFEKVTIAAIKPELVPIIWAKVSPMIQKAIDYSHGELDLSVILQRIIDGEMLLLTICEGDEIVASVVIEKREFQTGKNILNVTAAGGKNLHIWMKHLDEAIDKLAKEYNCDEVYIVGRVGWERMLNKVGFHKAHTVMSRKVRG